MDEHLLDVVNHNEGKWKRPDGMKGLLRVGVSPTIALRWRKIRREMTPKGLARKVAEQRN